MNQNKTHEQYCKLQNDVKQYFLKTSTCEIRLTKFFNKDINHYSLSRHYLSLQLIDTNKRKLAGRDAYICFNGRLLTPDGKSQRTSIWLTIFYSVLSLSKTHYPLPTTGSTQEDRKASQLVTKCRIGRKLSKQTN